MIDPARSQVSRAPWDLRVARIMLAVNKEASLLMWLGYSVYGIGSVVLMYLLRKEPALATVAVMFFFQLLVIFMGTRKMYPKLSASVLLMLEANRDAVPAFEELGDLVRDVRRAVETGDHPLVAKVDSHLSAITEHMKAVREAIERSTAPVKVVRRGAPAPVAEDTVDVTGEKT